MADDISLGDTTAGGTYNSHKTLTPLRNWGIRISASLLLLYIRDGKIDRRVFELVYPWQLQTLIVPFLFAGPSDTGPQSETCHSRQYQRVPLLLPSNKPATAHQGELVRDKYLIHDIFSSHNLQTKLTLFSGGLLLKTTPKTYCKRAGYFFKICTRQLE